MATGSDQGRVRSRFAVSDEIVLTGLLFLFAFFSAGLPRSFTSTAAHTAILERYGSGAMSTAYMLEALLVPLAGYFFVRVESRVKLRTLVLSALAFDVLMLSGLWLGLNTPSMPWIAYGGIIWFEVEFALVSLLLWGMASQLMTLRQAKRRFGLISAGEPAAIIFSGIITGPLLKFLKPTDLLLVSACGAVAGMVIAWVILSRFTAQREREEEGGEEGEGESEQEEQAPDQKWWNDGFVRILVMTLVISQLGYFFVDNAFYDRANFRYPQEEELATFLGKYSAVVGVISLLGSIFIAGPIVRRFGIIAGILTLPILLSIGCAAVIGAGWITSDMNLLFYLVVGNKVIDQSLRYTVDKTSSVTLYQVLPPAKRNGVQAALESIGEPLSGGIAGAILFALVHGLGMGAFGITHVIFIVAVTWVILAIAEYKGYLGALREALASRRLRGEGIAVGDETSLGVLHQSLRSERPGEVLYSMTLLLRHSEEKFRDELPTLLRHAHPEVRKAALEIVETHPWQSARALVMDVLAVEQAPIVIGAGLRAIAALDQANAVDIVGPYVTAADRPIMLNAYAALLRHGGIEGTLAVGTNFLALINSSHVEDRILAAEIIARTGSASLHRQLAKLLQDQNHEVKIAALRAAGEIKAPDLWPLVLAALGTQGCEAAAIGALKAGGEQNLAVLAAFLDNEAAAPTARRHAAEAIGLIGGKNAGHILAARLALPDRTISRVILRKLNQCRYNCPGNEEAEQALELFKAHIAETDWLINAYVDLAPLEKTTQGALLLRSLLAELEQRVESMAYLLGYMGTSGSLNQAWQILQTGSEEERAFLLEMLETQLPAGTRERACALVEEPLSHERLLTLNAAAASSTASPIHRLTELVERSAAVVTPWLRATALYVLACREMINVDDLKKWERFCEIDIVDEVLEWSVGKISAASVAY